MPRIRPRNRTRTIKQLSVRGDFRVRVVRNVSETEIEALAHRGRLMEHHLIAARLALADFTAASSGGAAELRDYVDSSYQGVSDGMLVALSRLAKIARQMKPECLRAWHAVVFLDQRCDTGHQLQPLKTALDIASDIYTSERLDSDIV